MEEFDMDRVIAKLASSCAAMVEADRCTVYMMDHERQELWSKVANGSADIFRIQANTLQPKHSPTQTLSNPNTFTRPANHRQAAE